MPTSGVPAVRPARRSVVLFISFVFIQSALLAAAPPAPVRAADPNPIVTENALPGNPASEWEVSGAGDASIQGFGTDISVDRSDTIDFKIDTTAASYDLRIYRLGYYGGNGARLVDTIQAVTGTDQPACSTAPIPMGGGATTSGQLLDCGNWSTSASWAVPADATSGVYIARPTRLDNGGASHIPFIVRDDASTSDMVFQTSDTTWQSYNVYGGYNAYGSSGATMAEKLSYNRPFTTRGAELENYLFNAEYPMIRWLERNGYDVSYMSAIDTERNTDWATRHDVFLSIGHDEYWSQGRRDAVTAARDAGVHLAFFSANEIYWKTRWEPSTADGGSTDYRTQVVYKEGSSAPSGSAEHRNCYDNYDCDPSDTWTGQWREAPGAVPENELSGQISWRLNQVPITVPGDYAAMRFWRNTEVSSLAPGAQVTLADGTLGYEWDPEYPEFTDSYPAGRVLLSTTNVTSFVGPEQHHLSLYRAASGALVFGAGTVQWSWGLDSNHDRGSAPEDPNMQQATANLFADMDVQPATLQANLVAPVASLDVTPPTVTVTAPAAGGSVPGGAVTITGTAQDADGVVAGVEVSTDGGGTWRRATGRDTWSHTYAAGDGLADIRVRAVDDSVRLSAPISHSFTVEPRDCSTGCTIWTTAPVGVSTGNDGAQPIEVGTKFDTAESGLITSIRVFKATEDTWNLRGRLRLPDGSILGESADTVVVGIGWMDLPLDSPVPVEPGTTYVASYFSSSGDYSHSDSYFATAYDNPPLRALAGGEDGPNGVYRYGAISSLPLDQTFQNANYWADVTFIDELPAHSFFDNAPLPAGWTADVSDNQAIELGMRFRTTVPGEVTALRFYKAPSASGQMTASLWTEAGALLASGSIDAVADEGGWREVVLDTPVPLTVGTSYVVSYFSPTPGWFVISPVNAFATDLVVGPLVAPAHTTAAPNGVYRYGGGFPELGSSRNYYVDVVVQETLPPDTSPPTVASTSPSEGAVGIGITSAVSVTFSEAMDAGTIPGNVTLAQGTTPVAATLIYDAPARRATLTPSSPLAYDTSYTATVKGGAGGVEDLAGNPLASDFVWTFTTRAENVTRPDPSVGPGGPVLVVPGTGVFGSYLPEIMRAEGLNLFATGGTGSLTAAGLASYTTVVLGESALSADQVTVLTDWVNAGGNLVTLRPDPALADLLGLTVAGGTLSEGYIGVDTAASPGAGIVGETMQIHGTADQYTAQAGTQVVATLYSNATTATPYPAVTLRSVGSAGGSAAAFTYDLARSVVLTRQGNPAWVNTNGDNSAGPVRADDLFHNGTDPDWVDLDKVAIPQADEQQRLFANLLTETMADALPLPRFWYLPRGEVAALVMTADEHDGGSVLTRMNAESAASSVDCSVDDWECIRSTSYLYPSYPSMSAAQASAFEDQGFEIALHPDTSCSNYTRTQFATALESQLAELAAKYPDLEPSVTSRNHCISWTDYTTIPEELAQQGIHLDTNYYFWPPAWVNDQPGLFTGSGFPQRFATTGGDLVDVYQATTQMTDESGQSYPGTAITLMDRAINQGYYGAFTINFHTDGAGNTYHGPVVAAAQARGVPVVSARQMLAWLDGRNTSSFAGLGFADGVLTFDIAPGAGSRGLEAMIPATSGADELITLTRGGSPVTFASRTVKGIEYAAFAAIGGAYTATYAVDEAGPVISDIVATPSDDGTATITWTTDEPATSEVLYGSTPDVLTDQASNAGLTTQHSVALVSLAPNATYHFRVRSTDGATNTTTAPEVGTDPLSFTMPPASLRDTTVADFGAGTLDGTIVTATANGEVTLAPAIATDFDGTTLPAGWESGQWTGGGATVAGGQLTADGGYARTTATYGPGRVLEFRATFGNTTYQNAGFGVDFDTTPSWATFGVGNTGGQLFARVNNGGAVSDFGLGAGLFGSAHTYRIEWMATEIRFFVDGNLVHTAGTAVSTAMRPILSDLTLGGPTLTVDWLRMSPPFVSGGTFTSRVLDAGQEVGWVAMNVDADVLTGITFDVRTGDVPAPDASWSDWTVVGIGTDIPGSTRYIQYRATLGTADANVTPVLQEVRFTYGEAESDTTPPTVTATVPTAAAADTDPDTTVSVTFSEAMDASTIDETSFTLRAGTTDVAASVSYASGTATLTPADSLNHATAYTATVTTAATDLAGIPLAEAYTWNFTTAAAPEPPTGFADTTVADFGGGTLDGTIITEFGDGEVTLAPVVFTDFNGTSLPTGWTGSAWDGGAPPVVAGGTVTLDQDLLVTDAFYAPSRTLEFVASFSAQNQHIGFANDFNTGQWAIFSSGAAGDQLYARSNAAPVINEGLGSGYLNGTHAFRIVWTATSATYFIDGVQVASHAATFAGNLRPAASDSNPAGSLVIDSMQMLPPYVATGTFESRVFDAESSVNWGALEYDVQTPDGTNLQISVRSGETATPDGTWSEWTAVADGADMPATGRYVQYRASLNTIDTGLTPALEEVRLSIGDTPPTNEPPTVSNPGPQTGTVGDPVSLQIVAFDLDDQDLAYDATGLPTGLTIAAETGLISGTLSAAGSFPVTVSVFDGELTDSVEFAWTVNPPNSFVDTTVADFNAGSHSGTYVTDTDGGEITLAPTLGAEFGGSTLPGGWESGPWTGGSATVAGGNVTVDGAYARTTTLYDPGRVLEFRATFGAATFQNAGFAVDFNDVARWAAFGIGATADQLYARVHNGTTQENIGLGAEFLGSAHTFRIDWASDAIRFLIDDELVHVSALAITAQMRPVASELNVGGPVLSVDWLRMTPYATDGTFTSRVFEAGSNADWGFVGYDAQTPVGASLALEVRTGDSAVPGGTWSEWTPVADGAEIVGIAPYAQYRATFTSSDLLITPVLEEVRLSYADGDPVPNRAPTITAAPSDQTSQVGDTVSLGIDATDPDGDTLTFSATGLPGGLAIDPGTGIISGTLTATGVFNVAVTVSDDDLDDTASFTWTVSAAPIPTGFIDTTVADFGAGNHIGTYLTDTAGGEVTLAPTVGAEFGGTALPSGWESGPWTGGSVLVAGGDLGADGAWARTTTFVGPGRAMEFRATFGAAAFQNAGLGQQLAEGNEQWLVFGTLGTVDTLFTRVNTGSGGSQDFSLGTGLVGSEHTYRIEWTTSEIRFYVDNVLRDTRVIALNAQLRPVVSDYQAGGPVLSVDWLRMTPYAASGTFESRIFDAGQTALWQLLSADAVTGSGTSFGFEVRTGDIATPDETWTMWSVVPESGVLNSIARYLQYRASLTTIDADVTPIIREVELTLGEPITNRAPVLAAIGDQNVAEGGDLSIPLSASDLDADLLAFSATLESGDPLPAWITLSDNLDGTASLAVNPGFGDGGAYTLTVTVSDGVASDAETFSLTVGATNRAPTFDQDLADRTDAEGDLISLDAGATDPDGDTLTYAASNLPSGLSIDTASGLISGTIAFSAAAGSPWAVEITVSDGGSVDATDSFSWTVTDTNRAPSVTNPGDQSGNVEDAVSLQIVALDLDGDDLAYTALGLPDGLAIDEASGLISGTLTTAGEFSVTVTVSDGLLDDSASFAWSVLQPNRAPVLDPIGDQSVAEGATTVVPLSAVDLDNDELTFSLGVGAPAWASLLDNLDGSTSLSLAPGYSDAEVYSLTVTVSDGSLSDAETFDVSVTDTNRAPSVTNPGDQSGNVDAAVSLQIVALDLDGDDLAYTALGLPDGLAIDETSGLISGTLTTAGEFSVTVTVSDGLLDDSASFAWSVLDVTAPTPPTGLTASVSTVAVTLSWMANTEPDLAGYRVYRSVDGGAFSELTTSLLTTTTFTDTTAPTQVHLTYQVVAVDGTGNASEPSATASAQRDIWFRGMATAQNGGKTSSITVARPGGTQGGDLLVTVIDVRGAATVTPPAGWILAQENATGNAVRQVTYYRIATAAEQATSVWTLSAKQGAAAVSLAYGGVHQAQPLDVREGQVATNSAQITAPSVPTSTDGALLIGAFGIATNASITPPGGMTGRAYASMNAGQTKVAILAADQLLPDAGATGSRIALASNAAANIGHAVAFRPSTAAVDPEVDTQPPTQPTGLVATAVSETAVSLAWVASTDNVAVVGYHVYRDGGSAPIATLVPGTTYTDATVVANTSYAYRVQAVDEADNGSALSNQASVTTPGGPPPPQPKITFVSASSGANKVATTLVIPRPSGVQAGDILVASVDVGGPVEITAPVGWTEIRTTQANGNVTKATYWRVAASNDPASWTWTLPKAVASGVIGAYRGVNTADPIVAHGGQASAAASAAIVAPSITTDVADTRLVAFYGTATNATISPATAMTWRIEVVGSGKLKMTSMLADEWLLTAGTTGARQASASKVASNVGHLIALRPAP